MEEDRHLRYLGDLQRRVQEWQPWTCTLGEVADSLGVDPSRGLDVLEARNRRAYFGANVPVDLGQHLGVWGVLAGELAEPMVVLLLIVGALYSLWGEPWDAATIFATILAVIGLEVATEWRAQRALASLRNSVPANTTCLRGGIEGVAASDGLVLGDVITVSRGQLVPADAVVVVCHGFSLDESMLTGEPDHVYKTALDSAAAANNVSHCQTGSAAGGAASQEHYPLPNDGSASAQHGKSALVYAGTKVATGRAVCIVVATGASTEIGANVAKLLRDSRPPPTALQQRMKRLAGSLSVVAIVLCLCVTGIGLVQGMHWRDTVLMGMSLAFATIPEELPLIAKASLALGCRRLSRHGLLVRRSQAADALSSVSVIVTDKTGTLTRNQLVVSSILAVTCAEGGHGLSADIVTPEAATATERSAALVAPLYCAWSLSVDPLEARPLARLLAVVRRKVTGRNVSGTSIGSVFSNARSRYGDDFRREFQPVRGFGKDFMNTAVLRSLSSTTDYSTFDPARDPDSGAIPLGRITDAIATTCRCLPTPTGELSFDPTLRVSALTRSPAEDPPCSSPLDSGDGEVSAVSKQKKHWTIIKGATEVLLPLCSRVWKACDSPGISDGEIYSGNVEGIVGITPQFAQTLSRNATDLAVGGNRVIAYAIAITDEPLFSSPQGPPAPPPASSLGSSPPDAYQKLAMRENQAYRFRDPAAAAGGSGRPSADGAIAVPTIDVADGRQVPLLPSDLVFVGAFAFFDPPQSEARPVLRECQDAGIRVIVATGDHPSTALAVASAVGITESHHGLTGTSPGDPQLLYGSMGMTAPSRDQRCNPSPGEVHAVTGEMIQRSIQTDTFEQLIDESNVFARVTPAQKLNLVYALQARGEVVAFIGDGINDAPSLTRADVGICMGGNPSTADVAMDAASLIVLSGNFSGVVRSLREGRRLGANISKCMVFYLACKAALVMVFLFLLVAEGARPLTPVQVIFLELFMDLGATWAFLDERPEGLAVDESGDTRSLVAQKAAASAVCGGSGSRGRRGGVLGGGEAADWAVVGYALALFTTCILPLLATSLLLPHWAVVPVAPTLIFLTWLAAHSLLGTSMRTSVVPLRVRLATQCGHQRQLNVPGVVWVVCSCLAVIVCSVIPPVSAHLGIVPLDALEWAMVVLAPVLLLLFLEARKEVRFRRVATVANASVASAA